MSSIALILTLCTSMGCNSYNIDSPEEWKQPIDCQEALVVESAYMARIWNSQSRLQAYLGQWDAVEPAHMLVDYDYSCERVK